MNIIAESNGDGGIWLVLVVVAVWIGYYGFTNSGKASRDRKAARKQAKVTVPGVACPTCHKHTVERNGLGDRVASGVAGGLLFSKGARAQFRCTSCGYLW